MFINFYYFKYIGFNSNNNFIIINYKSSNFNFIINIIITTVYCYYINIIIVV